jgi:hypothetical protein
VTRSPEPRSDRITDVNDSSHERADTQLDCQPDDYWALDDRVTLVIANIMKKSTKWLMRAPRCMGEVRDHEI